VILSCAFSRCASSLLIVALLFMFGCESGRQEDNSNSDAQLNSASLTPIKVTEVRRGAIRSWMSATGNVLAIRESRIGTKLSGKVARIFADDGDPVEAGNALFELEQDDFEIAQDLARHGLQAARAQLAAAKIGVENTEREFNRLQSLQATDAVSQQQCDAASDAYRTAQASLASAEAAVSVAKDALALAEYNIKQSTVRSPISGHVAKRYINVGEMLSLLSPIPCFYVIDDSICKVEASLPDKDQSRVALQQETKLTVDGVDNSEFTGRISYLSNTIDPVSRTFTVRVEIPNPDGLLRPGAMARLRILLDERNDVPTLPVQCVVRRNGSSMVFVIRSEVAFAVPVGLGLSGDDSVEITDGLALGDVVVLEGAESLEDGTRVHIINPRP